MAAPYVLADPAAPPLRRKRWTTKERDEIEAAGICLDQYELLNGQLIRKMGKHPPDMRVETVAAMQLRRVFGELFVIANPTVDLPDPLGVRNSPEPDLAVLSNPVDELSIRPAPRDIVLVVEVADSSVTRDLTYKAELYGGAGISEYWLFLAGRRKLVVHRGPREGGYGEVFEAGESIAPLARPDAALPVEELFGKVPRAGR